MRTIGIIFLLLTPIYADEVTFNMFADAHIKKSVQGDVNKVVGSGYNAIGDYRALGITHWKLDDCIRNFNIKHPQADFMIELGDLKGSGGTRRTTVHNTNDILDACERMDNWEGDIYHIIGNHDLQMKDTNETENFNDYIAALNAAGHTNDMNNPARNNRGYYSFTIGNFHFIALDTNGGWDEANDVEYSYYNGSPHYKTPHIGDPNNWVHMEVGIHQEQLDWIKIELESNATKNIVFFSHHCLGRNDWQDPSADVNNFFINNHTEFHAVLNDSNVPNDRIVCFSGHAHAGAFSNIIDNIRYFNLRGMVLGTVSQDEEWTSRGAPVGNNAWVGDPNLNRPAHNSYCTVTLSDSEGVLVASVDNYDLPDFYYTDIYNRWWHTPQKMPCEYIGDLNNDCRVDFRDFAVLAYDWQISYDMNDLTAMMADWLIGY